MPLNPHRNGDFRLKKTLSSDCFGPIEHLAWLSSPNLDVPRAEAWGVEEISATIAFVILTHIMSIPKKSSMFATRTTKGKIE